MGKKPAKKAKMNTERKQMGAYNYLWRKEMKMTKGTENARRGRNN